MPEKDEMSQKEKEIFEAQLMKEAEIRDRLKEARIFLQLYNHYEHFLIVTCLALTLGKSIRIAQQKFTA